ncbi:MAG: hypothetical protein CL731_00665 [Chloroflexi bacterium]|nr:hypothetical protein [Chloroflexota bacterium]
MNFRVAAGALAKVIADEALTREGSVIVMVTHGSGEIKRSVIGSFTDKTILSSHRPALVIPPKSA